ncbi:MAG: hypothetical protein NVSMB62_18860 [Acidobacteriaceae bacterium]
MFLTFWAAVCVLWTCERGGAPIYAASASSVGLSAGAAAQTTSGHPGDPVGAQAYAEHCAICHGDQREGIQPGFPPLRGLARHLNDSQISDLIHNGKGRMPGFPNLPQPEVAGLLRFLANDFIAAATTADALSTTTPAAHPAATSGVGGALFQQNCAFCHGRDTQGGESGPDLTRSKLVQSDVMGDKISEVVRNGRPEKKMPAFNFSKQELLDLAEFIHAQEARAVAQKGKRKGVDVADLQTGNVEAGQQYFNGAGTCSTCHSARGDLAGIASRYEGLQLEQRMLYPRDAKSRVTVTLPSGERITGTVAYRDEFTVALRDAGGVYRSWAVGRVKYSLDSPVTAHAELFSKYTDEDIHNLMAYLQTLR